MSKITLNDVGNLIDATTAVATINDNSAAIVTAMDNTLSRDGTSPNQMESDLDMNSNKILNLPDPINPTDVVRLKDIEGLKDFAEIEAEITRANDAVEAATDALNTFKNVYYGAYASDPSTDPSGNPPSEGDMYFNSTNNVLMIWVGDHWEGYSATAGDVSGPSSSVDGHLVGFDGTTGKVIKDLGSIDDLLTQNSPVIALISYVPAAERAAILAGTSTYDASTAVQNAITENPNVTLDGQGGTYNISVTVVGVNNIKIVNAKFKQTAQTAHPLFDFSDKSYWHFDRCSFIGDNDQTLDQATSWTGAIKCFVTTSANVVEPTITRCTFSNFSDNYLTLFSTSTTQTGAMIHPKFLYNNVSAPTSPYLVAAHYCFTFYGQVGGATYGIEVSHNYIDGSGLTVGPTFFGNHVGFKANYNLIRNVGAHSTFSTPAVDLNCYGLLCYNHLGTAGTYPTDGEFTGNIIISPPSAGIYVNQSNNMRVQNNTIINQYRTDTNTLPRGGISFNGANDFICSGNFIDGFGGICAASIEGQYTGLIEGNSIRVGGTGARGIDIRGYSLAGSATIHIRGNTVLVSSGTDNTGVYLSTSNTSPLGKLLIEGNNFFTGGTYGINIGGAYTNNGVFLKNNTYGGPVTGYMVYAPSITNSSLSIQGDTLDLSGAAGYGVVVDSCTSYSVNGLTIRNKSSGNLAWSAASSSGQIKGVVFSGVSSGLIAGGNGTGAPGFAGNPGDYVQALGSPSYTQAGASGNAYTIDGWVCTGGSSWYPRRVLTGN